MVAGKWTAVTLLLGVAAPSAGAPPVLLSSPPGGTAADQTSDDSYTRYELLAPGSSKFRILYRVSATEPGARSYFNPIRKGSRASDERVTDLATGKPLTFRIVSGKDARANGLADADEDGEYVQIQLARPVPDGGESRILIDKTYEDAKSYYVEGDTIVFDRSLGVDRNAIVLPAGYRLTHLNLPAQVLEEPDGRIKVSFLDTSPTTSPLIVKARRGQPALPTASAAPALSLDERAAETSEIVYFLRQPETHAFDLSHDYTETRAQTATYVNVVRAGSGVTDPRGMILDTGAPLAHRLIRGAEVARAAPDATGVTSSTEAVVFSFPPVPEGGSTRIRIAETYTDPARFRLVGDELVWERRLGRAANAVVLPNGWVLTNSSAPAIVSETTDGRTRLDFLNPRNDELDVLITARRKG